MKREIDLSRSKRAIPVPDEGEIPTLNVKLAKIGQKIAEMEDLERILEDDVPYKRIVFMSETRVYELVNEQLEIPLNEKTMILHAELRGRIGERIRLTKELDGV